MDTKRKKSTRRKKTLTEVALAAMCDLTDYLCPPEMRRAIGRAKNWTEIRDALGEYHTLLMDTGKIAVHDRKLVMLWPVSSFLGAFGEHGMLDVAATWLRAPRTCHSLREFVSGGWQNVDVTVLDVSHMEGSASVAQEPHYQG